VSADTSLLISALNHSLRRRILRRVDEDGGVTSARQLARQLGLPIGNVSYHLQVLAKLDVLKQTHARQVRGATEYFYVSNLDGQADWFRAALNGSRDADERSGRSRSTTGSAARGASPSRAEP
jgi:DNA-binding transcriptional ArsR family regulator